MLSGSEVAKHSSSTDLWMIIAGKVYDLTEFAPNHPGGSKILLKYAGKDATEEYEPIHSPGTIEGALSADKHLGQVDMTTVEKIVVKEQTGPINGSIPMNLDMCLNLTDIEQAAESLLKPKAFAYYASAADDEKTKDWNRESFSAVRFRPRVLVDVSQIDLSATILGHRYKLPIFIAPAAMGRLAHPDGEKCLVRAAAKFGVPYIVSANASISFEELASIASPSQNLMYQLYVDKDRSKTEEKLKRVHAAGFKAICVTVDAPVAGKRERDERSKLDADTVSDPSMRNGLKTAPDKVQGIAQSLGSYVDARLKWSDLAWIKKTSGNLPLFVKGIQSAEDAALCADCGVDGIYLSNHGGRQLEGAPSSLETLLEIRKFAPQVFEQCEIYLDGGIKRGTDILKAIALGATAVGIGRPFMYSLVFGDQGPEKVLSILEAELSQNLRLLGATELSELNPRMINARALEQLVYDGEYTGPGESVAEKGKRVWQSVKGKF